MKFRHFFRSSYGIELDIVRLRELAETVPPTQRSFHAEVESFLSGSKQHGS